MVTYYSEKIINIAIRELGELGKIIFYAKCRELKIEPENIVVQHLVTLSEVIPKSFRPYISDEKIKSIADEIANL